MLNRIRCPRMLVTAVLFSALALTSLATFPAEASAQSEVTCPVGQVVGPGAEPGERLCYAYTSGGILPVNQPLRVSASASGAVQRWCYRRNDGVDGWAGPHRVPCHTSVGWYNPRWDCYVKTGNEWQLELIDYIPPRWDLADNEPGRLWEVRCYPPKEDADNNRMWAPGGDPFGVWVSSMLVNGPDNPTGWGGLPAVVPGLFAEAVNALGLVGPVIATSPPLHRGGIVNLPIWLWTEDQARTWPDEPLHARADARPDGIDAWVDVWAEPVHIAWHPGDGSDPVVCDQPGVKWVRGMGDEGYGECAHTYRWHSHDEPFGVYLITGVTTWRLHWQANGGTDSGVLEVQVGSTADYPVREVHVLVYHH